MLRVLVLVISIVMTSGCAVGFKMSNGLDVKQPAIDQLNAMYDPYIEKGVCVDVDHIHNIQVGTGMSSPVPLCNIQDIVLHTHPQFAEKYANFIDGMVWKEYFRRYGNTKYSMMYAINGFRFYLLEVETNKMKVFNLEKGKFNLIETIDLKERFNIILKDLIPRNKAFFRKLAPTIVAPAK